MEENRLIPPCAYQGGKQRIAKQIVDKILKDNPCLLNEDDETLFYDLCCGSGAISIEMINRGINPLKIIMVDASPWGEFYKNIGNGTFSLDIFKQYIDDIPDDINKIKEYAKSLILLPVTENLFDDMACKFLILQSCAFGGTATWVDDNKWKKAGGLRSYWLPTETSKRRSPVNPMMPMPNTLFKRVEGIYFKMNGIRGYYDYIENIDIQSNSVIYIDPPYEHTSQYGFSIENLIEYIDKIKNNNKLYVSEGKQLSEDAFLISAGRAKGGISGKRNKEANEEWLNIY